MTEGLRIEADPRAPAVDGVDVDVDVASASSSSSAMILPRRTNAQPVLVPPGLKNVLPLLARIRLDGVVGLGLGIDGPDASVSGDV